MTPRSSRRPENNLYIARYKRSGGRYLGSNRTVYELPSHVQQLKSDREDGQTFGVYLMIPSVEQNDFGTYVLDPISYPNPNPVPFGRLILLFSALACCVLAVGFLHLRFGLRVRVHLKDSFGPLENREGDGGDVLIVHSSQDSEIALGVLLVDLEKYQYKCETKELDTNTTKSVFSPALVDQQWDSDHVLHAIKQLQTLTPKLIVVALKELPKDEAQPKNSQGETLATITRSVPMLQWTRRDNEKFWYALRLELPAKRNTVNHQISSDKETRLTDSCKDTNVDDIV
ncbi:unnamed protein product [Acanthoscelides obtectus]|uniref:Uncharacterized protein n=1 Tax=Acanthoscelides obtectus TaxID=200917 RepID=A0A9P0PRJ9_ACAOB|nr:unnamed protein product [Acanthoscelides obtectus]CAK1637629.1 hypothetical protein AOBTE_LOCUS10099 [Acanthoscelides obtectus]